MVPRVCSARHPDEGHGRGPHPGPQGRLGCVHGSEQPPEPVPPLPQPQDCGGNEQKPSASAALIPEEIGGRLGARRLRPAPVGFLAPSPRPVEVFATAGNTAGPPPYRIFSPRESRRRSGGSPARRTSEGQGAAGAQRKTAKRCEGAAETESHGIDQKPERQESARTGSVRVGPCFFVFSGL